MDPKHDRLHIDLPTSTFTSIVQPKPLRPLPATSKLNTKSKPPAQIVDSWEDDVSEPDSDTQTPTSATESLKPVESIDDPALKPPPPTPISPQDWSPATVLGGGRPKAYSNTSTPPQRSDSDSERRRPETTSAAAGRMIAASLGMKVPKKTEEQKQYDRAMKEKEIKRREKERADQEREKREDEEAKKSVWDG